jgi:hypothetical protein
LWSSELRNRRKPTFMRNIHLPSSGLKHVVRKLLDYAIRLQEGGTQIRRRNWGRGLPAPELTGRPGFSSPSCAMGLSDHLHNPSSHYTLHPWRFSHISFGSKQANSKHIVCILSLQYILRYNPPPPPLPWHVCLYLSELPERKTWTVQSCTGSALWGVESTSVQFTALLPVQQQHCSGCVSQSVPVELSCSQSARPLRPSAIGYLGTLH